MGTIHLHPNDRAKYGTPEEGIPFDFATVGVRQRAALEKATKMPWNYFLEQLRGVPELDEHGNTIPVPVVDNDGKPVLNDDGTEKVTEKLARNGDAVAAMVWVAMWGIGIKVPWDTFDVTEAGLVIDLRGVDEDDDDEGKAPESTTDTASTST